jgi:hypothetical protein
MFYGVCIQSPDVRIVFRTGPLGDLDTVDRAEVFSRDPLEQNKGGDKTGVFWLDFLKRVIGPKVKKREEVN